MLGFSGTNQTVVVKLGGAVFSADATHIVEDLQAISQTGARVVVVHGGGNSIDAALIQAGIKPQKVNGMRVTDAETLSVVIQVLDAANCIVAGMIPQADPFPSAISVLKANKAKVDGVDLGLVGEVIGVDSDPLFVSLSQGKIPVVAPIGYDKSGCALNINADSAAAAIATALGASWLLLLSDVPGVLAPAGIVTSLIDMETCKNMIEAGTITGGMIPKTQTAIKAVDSGVQNVVIADGLSRHAVRECLRRRRGTLVRR